VNLGSEQGCEPALVICPCCCLSDWIMRIALVTETFPPEINGVAMTLSRLTESLRSRGHQLQVIRPSQRGEAIVADDLHITVPGIHIPYYPEIQIGTPSKKRLMSAWRTSPPDLCHVATEGPLGSSAVSAARALCIPLISSFHTNFHHYSSHYGIGWMEDRVGAYLRGVHNMAEATLVPDRNLICDLEKIGFTNLVHFARGVDSVLFHPGRRDPELRKAWGADDLTTVWVHVSRLAKEKNIPFVIECWRKAQQHMSRSLLVMVGDGPERTHLQASYKDVIFTGYKQGVELATHYASADFFAFASQTETFGNVVMEALASGLVTVTWDYAATRQFVKDGYNGYTAEAFLDDDFHQTITTALNERHRWEAVRSSARTTAEGNPWTKIVDEYEKIARAHAVNPAS